MRKTDARLLGVPPPNKSRLPQQFKDNRWSLKSMTFTEGRPSGRSQHLMCVFEDKLFGKSDG